MRQELVRPTVDIALGDDVVASLEQSHDRGRDGAHTGREGERGIDSFQFGHGLFCDSIRGIAVTRVVTIGAGDAELFFVVGDLEG